MPETVNDLLFRAIRDNYPQPYLFAFDAVIGNTELNPIDGMFRIHNLVTVYYRWASETGRDEPDLVHRIEELGTNLFRITDLDGNEWTYTIQAIRA